MSKNTSLGEVIHYYDKIGVAVVKLSKGIKTGDQVKFVHGEDEFEQSILSMQLDHEMIDSGKKGQEVAIKVNKVAKSGTKVLSV